MRTHVVFGTLASVDQTEMNAVEGGGVLAVSTLTGTAISKYMDEITDRLSPTPVIGPDRIAEFTSRLP